jgi:2-polyprenyl-3-methyl-5-hydroxy-6-metoxy-1,4-benzoquinol methylase
MDPRNHWQRVYTTRKPTEVSWYQPSAAQSLEMIRQVAPDHSAAIIDVGGGASTLVDGLLADGYTSVTVLDVSSAALAAASARLAGDAARVTWLEANVFAAALPASGYDLWHDRAVFHFLTEVADRRRYVEQVRAAVRPGGHVIVATFAQDGPARCSGLEVARYAPEELHGQFGDDFQLLESAREEHHTPSGVVQPFVYCLCRLGDGRKRTTRGSGTHGA